MEPQATLVGTESRVELNTVTPVDVELSLVVLPDNTELDDTLRNGNNGKALLKLGVNLEELGGLESGDKLAVGLLEFWLSWVVGHFDGNLGGMLKRYRYVEYCVRCSDADKEL